MHIIARLLLSLLVVGLLALPARPARAGIELGYLWTLAFDFENDFDAVLKVRVGPWEDGDLVAVDETSSTTVACKAIGNVSLDAGDAVFDGGHLVCELDIAAIVFEKHGLVIDPVDSYGSILLTTELQSTAANVAPLITHPDAAYSISFVNPGSVTLIQGLQNGLGRQSFAFPHMHGAERRSYSFTYGCVWLGPCQSFIKAGNEATMTPAGGTRVSFRTGPARLLVGGNGVSTFSGRMGNLLIDPGNSVH